MSISDPQPDPAVPSFPPVRRDAGAPISGSEIRLRFTYHPPTGNQPAAYDEIRARAREFAQFLVDVTPGSREQSLAITALEEAVFWANAAIARRSGA